MATRRTTTRVYSVPKFCRVLSFLAVVLMGLGIAIGVVFGWWPRLAKYGWWIKEISVTIGMIAICWYSYYEARIHGTTWFTLWIIAVIFILIFQVLGFTPWFNWWKK